MFSKSYSLIITLLIMLISTSSGFSQTFPESQDDPVLKKILELGKNDNQTMKWLDYMTNRFGPRISGTDAYNNGAKWALYQFHKWGVQAELQEAGEMPVGFDRGAAYGKITVPGEKYLFFTTPAFSAGTKGRQRGPVIMAPGSVEEIEANKSKLKGVWVLVEIPSNLGYSERRTLTQTLKTTMETAGALGMIQGAKLPHRVRSNRVNSWDQLPTLPEITLLDTQYDEIKTMVEAGQDVELEFDINNGFIMGPVKYYNIIAWLPGTDYPDECIILSGHFDTVAGSDGAVDCGNGCTPAMEAIRIIAKAGGKPKRTIMVHLFAAEEIGIFGSQAWLRQHPSSIPKIATLINRDYNPGAVIGATVPQSWHEDFKKITKPLENYNPDFPFKLSSTNYPGTRSVRPGGTDASAFSMYGVPTLRLSEETDHVYNSTYHTTWDTYDDVAPYTKHQEHTAVTLAVMAYGIANLDHQLPREDVYLADGLYADINTAKGRMIASLDYKNAPETVASFVKLFEDPNAQGGRRRYGRQQRGPSIGVFSQKGAQTVAKAKVTAKANKSRASGSKLKKERNTEIKQNKAGVLGMTKPTEFYITSGSKSGYDNKFTAIGNVIAGLEILNNIAAGDSIRSVRINRIGKSAINWGKK